MATFHGYVHVPFCRVRCGYCDFNTYTATELDGASQSNYAETLVKEIAFSAAVLAQSGIPARNLNSVFFGGGTPTQLPANDLVKILSRLEAGLETVEVQLKSATTYADSVAKNPARHLVDAGGKRIRPALVLLAAQFGDPTRQEVYDAAVVVELTHLATLYHDDVMDDAPTRRGVPTAQHVWGNSVAILTGDLLFARASQVGSNLGQASLTLQADTFERLCLGQLHETVGPSEGQDPIAHYVQVLADKTG